jgi:hypothetical protein
VGTVVTKRALLVLALLCVAVGAFSARGADRVFRLAQVAASSYLVALAVPERANAHVSLASSGRFVVAVWSAATKAGPSDIYAAVSVNDGASFGAPVRVNSTPGAVQVNGEQPPRVALSERLGATPQITVIWTAKTPPGTALLTSRSVDGGRTFDASSPVMGADTLGNRGWEALGADSKGKVHAVWLDHRRLASARARAGRESDHSDHRGATHDHGVSPATAPPNRGAAAPTDGVQMAQQSDLYFDTLGDAEPPRALTAGVCYCCKTAVAFGRKGEIFLAWRHVYPGNFRDIAFTSSTDGGRTFAPPVRVSHDNWMLTGCPDDGPAMQVDGQGHVHIVWPTVVTEHGAPVKALFHASSEDGRTFSQRARIPTVGQANHPQLAIDPAGTLVLAWDESGDGSRRIVQGRGVAAAAGHLRFTRSPIGGETGVYPSVAATRGGAVVAWTSGVPDASVINLVRLP